MLHRRVAEAVLSSLVLLLLGCGAPRPDPVTGVAGPTYALSVNVPFAELSVPKDSRDGRAPPKEVPIVGEWTSLGASPAGLMYQHALPIRPRALFFLRAPEGMQLLAPNGPLPYRNGRNGAWTFDSDTVSLALPPSAPPPASMVYSLVYPLATEREAALNLQFSGKTADAFARARIQAGPDNRGGLLLPAPAVASFDLTLPPAAELSFAPGLVAPETLDAEPSDGATFTVEVEVNGAVTPVWTQTLAGPTFTPTTVDLSKWAGQAVRLRFRTDPGATSRFDYAFFADPIVAPRRADPKRVVVVFIDTLRADHVGAYGYDKDTTPNLDAFAKGGVLIEHARSVAPWTLPSTRAALTGRQPEFWGVAAPLQARARAAGWTTAMFAGNVYLSANFDMEQGWGLHHVVNWPQAADQVDLAVNWLDQADGHDALVLLHLMDAHLPYDEPEPFASKFVTGPRPASLHDGFERASVLSAGRDPEVRRYVGERYDNSIAYLDHELGRLFAKLRPHDIVAVFADHGEELWDHGGFEHGHTLREELLRVPLIVRAPGLPAGRSPAQASLLDLTPTLAELAGLPAVPTDGRSLVPALRGDAAALGALAARPIAFGRPLYGPDRWGAVLGDAKYATDEGKEQRWDLKSDPGERANLLKTWDPALAAEGRGWVAAGLGRPVHVGWRIEASSANASPKADLVATFVVPGGVRFAVAGDDPTGKSDVRVTVDGDKVEIRWRRGIKTGGEAFVVPTAPIGTVAPVVTIGAEGEPPTPVPVEGPRETDGTGQPFARGHAGGRAVTLGFGLAPEPAGEATSGTNAEVMDTLQALGYAVGRDKTDDKPDEKPAPKPEKDTDTDGDKR